MYSWEPNLRGLCGIKAEGFGIYSEIIYVWLEEFEYFLEVLESFGGGISVLKGFKKNC